MKGKKFIYLRIFLGDKGFSLLEEAQNILQINKVAPSGMVHTVAKLSKIEMCELPCQMIDKEITKYREIGMVKWM